MEPVKKDKGESLWQQMLESMLTQKTEKVGNLLWCGANKAGKKKLIGAIQELAKHHKPKKQDDTFKSLEKVYIMDFKYVKVNRKVNEYTEEQSKLNFYIINRQIEYMKEFLTTDMLSNLLAVVVVDLEDPKTLRSSLEEWIVFIKGCIRDFVGSLSEEKKKSVLKSLRDVKTKMRNLSAFSTLDGYHYETAPIPENMELEVDEEEANEEFAEPEIPLLIIGNKTDVLDKTNDEKLLEHLQYVLREAAVKHGAMVMTTSSQADRNLHLLYKVVGNVLIDMKDDDAAAYEPSYNTLKMFVPLGVDDTPLLNSQIPYADNYVFKEKVMTKQDVKKSEKSDIKDIAEFLSDINKGQFAFQNMVEGATSKNDPNRFSLNKNSSRILGDTGPSGINRSSRFLDEANPETKSKYDKIRGILENR